MRSPLALLLAISLDLDWSGTAFIGSTSQKTGLGQNAGQVCIDGCKAMLSWCKNGVGMLNVGARKVLHARLKGGKCNNNLMTMVSNWCPDKYIEG